MKIKLTRQWFIQNFYQGIFKATKDIEQSAKIMPMLY